MSNNYRTVVGILDKKLFTSKSNGHECAYVIIAFEKFADSTNPKGYSYDRVNVKEFFCESNQVFLTSNADQVQSKYGDYKLIQMNVGESLKSDTKCNYTVYSENIKDVPVDDFIEILNCEVPDANAPFIYTQRRLSTRFVLLSTEIYMLEGVDCTSREFDYVNVFYNEKEASSAYAKALKIFPVRFNQGLEERAKQMADSDSEAENEETKRFLGGYLLNKIYQGALSSKNTVPPVNDLLRNAVEDFCQDIESNDQLQYSVAREVERKMGTAEPGDGTARVRIVKKKVFVGPFLANLDLSGSDGSLDCYKYTLAVADKGSFVTKDQDNATIKYFKQDEVADHVFHMQFGDVNRSYLVQLDLEYWNNLSTTLDYIDNKKIVDRYCAPALQKEFRNLRSSSSSMSHFSSILQSIKNLRINPRRCRRALALIENVANFDSQRSKLFGTLEEMSDAKRFICEYIDAHASDMLLKYRKDMLDDIKTEQKKARSELSTLESQITAARTTLNKINKTVGAQESKVRQPPKPRTVSEEEHGVLMAEHKQLMRDCEAMRKELETMQKTKDKLGDELRSEVAGLSARYLDMHSMLKAFTSVRTGATSGFSFDSQPVSCVKIDNINKSRNRFIEDLSRSLRGMGRCIDRSKLVAAVVTIAQNKFTIFAGLPGSGKTSFVKCLGKALNLNKRMLPVPVARGWTSQRDILGYWNSLAGIFQAAPTGLWELLNTLDAEKSSSLVTPSIVLLDEMNLSSPEHYFSSFMDLGSGESDGLIFTGSPEKPYLKVPDYLHFIGTVNSDDTVNVMSPRMMDRAAVILFEERPSQGEDNRILKQNLEAMQTYSAKDWSTLFASGDATTSNGVYQVLTEIEEHLSSENSDFGQRIVVSFRKHHQFLNFVNVALSMLDNDEQLTLDFAVKQFILPLISGIGEAFGKRLERLDEIFTKYELVDSSRLLQQIIAEGADRMNSYQFLN